jgi:hypothetical protein
LRCASTWGHLRVRCGNAVQFLRPAKKGPKYDGMPYGRVFNKCNDCFAIDKNRKLQVAMKEKKKNGIGRDDWEKCHVEPERGDAEACNAAVAELSPETRFEYFVGILNIHYTSVLDPRCVCKDCKKSRNLRKENGAWRLYDHCCAPGGAAAAKKLTDDEKKKHAKAEFWPFTKFTPTDEGWKIQRREATDAQKNTKKNELKYVGTIMPGP